MSTAADINKILKERKQNCLPVFLTMVMCSYLQFLHPQPTTPASDCGLGLPGEPGPPQGELGQLLADDPGVMFSSPDTPCRPSPWRESGACSTGKPDGDELLSPPLRQGQSSHSQPREVFAPKIKKNKHGRVTPPLPSDGPVGIKIPPPDAEHRCFKRRTDYTCC